MLCFVCIYREDYSGNLHFHVGRRGVILCESDLVYEAPKNSRLRIRSCEIFFYAVILFAHSTRPWPPPVWSGVRSHRRPPPSRGQHRAGAPQVRKEGLELGDVDIKSTFKSTT